MSPRFDATSPAQEDADIILRILLECPGGVCGGFVQVPVLGANRKIEVVPRDHAPGGEQQGVLADER